jgi:aryl-phospho-beta-D-glucosidase BglC (GH1 family)
MFYCNGLAALISFHAFQAICNCTSTKHLYTISKYNHMMANEMMITTVEDVKFLNQQFSYTSCITVVFDISKVTSKQCRLTVNEIVFWQH